MKKLIWLFIIFDNSLQQAQTFNVKVYYQKKEDTITLLLDNADPFPYSFEFSGQPNVENMRSVGEHFSNQFVGKGNTTKMRLAQFVPLDKSKPFAFKKIPPFTMYKGDFWKEEYDETYEYDLPYATREKFLLYQGYDGNETHRNQNALDFTMPIGTEVLAAREGYVIELKQDSNTGCPENKCANLGNFIKIIHSDGTIAEYYHLKMNSSKVKFGDKVKKGQTIALSGNTGWSTGPHLHFMCYLPRPKGKNISIKTLFRVDGGDTVKFLSPGNTYRRNY